VSLESPSCQSYQSATQDSSPRSNGPCVRAFPPPRLVTAIRHEEHRSRASAQVVADRPISFVRPASDVVRAQYTPTFMVREAMID